MREGSGIDRRFAGRTLRSLLHHATGFGNYDLADITHPSRGLCRLTIVTILLLGLIASGVVAAIVYAVVRRGAVAPVDVDGSELSFYEVAYLAGGRKRVALAGMAYLVWSGMLEVRDGSGTVALLRVPPADVTLAPVEEAILQRVPMEGVGIPRVQGAAEVAAGWLAEEMPGLVTPPRVAWRLGALAIGPALAALAVAVLVLVSRDGRSVGLLITVPFVALVVVMAAWISRPGVTPAGREALEATARRLEDDLRLAEVGVTSLPMERGMYIVALYGRKALTGGLLSLRRVTRP